VLVEPRVFDWEGPASVAEVEDMSVEVGVVSEFVTTVAKKEDLGGIGDFCEDRRKE
jgi:hypothetical protein